MERLGMPEGEPIEHPWVNKAISNAQRKVERRNFDIRKQLLEYDDVANQQRQIIYEQRHHLMEADDISDTIEAFREEVLEDVVSQHIPPGSVEEEWDVAGLEEALYGTFGLHLPVSEWLEADTELDEEGLKARLHEAVTQAYRDKEARVGSEVMRELEKVVTLQVLDTQWKDHLAAMDHLKEGIHLRGYAQRQPLQEYKREAFSLFEELLSRIRHESIELVYKVQVQAEGDVEELEGSRSQPSEMAFSHPTAEGALATDPVTSSGGHPAAPGEPPQAEPVAETPETVRRERKVGRNEPCPCGSGKKYKHCCGRAA
jgi:preprotein translocase subunit SecA